MFGDIYSGLPTLITGHTGFKGSWLAAWLLALGAKITGFANGVPTTPALSEAIGLAGRIEQITGDVRNRAEVAAALDSARPSIVFHLAAQALVRESFRDPCQTFETNMLGTLNVLEACRHCPSVKAAVIITSDKCYRNNEWVFGYRETDRLGGADPYSASKACAEIISHSYFDSFFQNGPACATARAGNVIGGGDWADDRIVPDCARAWARGEPAQIRNPGATRPWQLVLEPLSGYLWLGSLLLRPDAAITTGYQLAGQSYNFGPPANAIYPVSEVVAALARHWPGFKSESLANACADMPECGLLKLCCDKALAELKWQPTLNFEETIRYTAEWYAAFYAGHADMWSFTQGQIAAYCAAAQNRELAWTRA
ncbi:MAG: CDP-glucose 4,6-dehydratase [Desulfovibrio sp.]|nr:CDP-glucose 4,6-dehydratase [Desulfovibrio sp.]